MRALRLVGLTPGERPVDLTDAVAPLAERLPACCTALELVDERALHAKILVSSDYTPGGNLVWFGSLDAVWAIRHLRSLRLDVADVAQLDLGTVDAPALESFALFGLRWPIGPYAGGMQADTLAAARWPRLAHLALRLPEPIECDWPAQDGAYVPHESYRWENPRYDSRPVFDSAEDWEAELGELLEALRRVPLERLSLTAFASSRALLEALEAHGLPGSLLHLDLSGSNLDDDDAAWMVEHGTLFARLRTLDLRDTLIQDPGPLANLGPEVLHRPGSGSVYQFSVGRE
jgi:hypothetical protein